MTPSRVRAAIMIRRLRPISLHVVALCALLCAALAHRPATEVRQRSATPAQSSFAARVAALSEPAGYFDTDNLISNERSYLQVLPALDAPDRRAAASTSASAPIRTSRTSPTSGRRSRSSSTSAATTCCCTCSSRRCSPKRARGSSTSRCCSAVRCHRDSTRGATPTSTGCRRARDACAAIAGRSTRFARGSTDASPASAFRSRAKISPRSTGSIGDSSRPVRRCSSKAPAGRRRATTRPTAICCSRRTRGAPTQLPGVRGIVSVPQIASRARLDRAGGW